MEPNSANWRAPEYVFQGEHDDRTRYFTLPGYFDCDGDRRRLEDARGHCLLGNWSLADWYGAPHVAFHAGKAKSGENVRDILKEVPLERILFETDGPFLPPQSVRKDKKLKEKYAQPKDIKEIIQTACEVKNITYEKMERVTDENYERLFVL